MATVQETIRVVITGANPQTLTFTVPVDTATGAGLNALSIPYVGVNSGSDSVVAYMDSHSLTSNTADVVWQPVNGAVALGPVNIVCYGNNSETRGWPGGLLTGAGDNGRTFPYTTTGTNSLVYNEVIQNYPINPYCAPNNTSSCGGGYKSNPTQAVNQTNTGVFSSVTSIAGTNTSTDNGSNHPGFVLDITSSFIVNTKGTYTFYINYANVSSFAMYIGGASNGGTATFSSVSSLSSGNTGNPFPSLSPAKGYKLAIADTNMTAKSHPAVDSVYVTFSEPGVYPIEFVYNQFYNTQFSGDNNSFFQVTYLSGTQSQSVGTTGPGIGSQNLPVTILSAPPAGAAPSGALRLTPTGGAAGLLVQGATDTLTLTVQNVVYSSIPYMPILEGTSGYMTITNSGTNFNFQTYNGHAVNTTAAASNVFSVSGTNTSGLFTITSTGTAGAPFRLNYNGGAFSFITPTSDIANTDLTLTADDIAWFDSTNNSFDLFSPVGGAGGISYTIDVDFMTKPTVASVSPKTLVADGILMQAITIHLSQPFSPQQQGKYGTGNTIVPSASATGGVTLASPLSPILDGAGYLQGWSTSLIVPTSTTNGSFNLSMTVTGTLTYLSGGSFVTGTVTYISGVIATITTTGDQYVAPTAVSLATTPSSTALSDTAATTLTATVYTFDNSALTLAFSYKYGTSSSLSGTTVSLGNGTLSSSYTGIVSGKTAYYKVFTLSHTFSGINGTSLADGDVNLGFVVTDTVSHLATTYYSTTNYTLHVTIIIPPGHCFTGNVRIKTPDGLVSFDSFPHNELFKIENEHGVFDAELVIHQFYQGWMLKLADDKYVTLDHLLKNKDGVWVAAESKYPDAEVVWLEGTVYNLHVHADGYDEKSYILETGDVAHNLKA